MTEERAKLKIACPGCLQKLDVTDLDAFAQVKCPRCGGDVIAPKPFGALLLEEPLGQRCGVASYRALDLTLDREVLVRIFEHDPGGLGEGFQALARRAAGVNHPGVVPIYSCGSEQGLPYLVSQFLAGGPVAGRLADWTVSEESTRRAAEWLRQVAAGLQAAAAQAVVHGAVSPQSIFLDADGNAKLGDFGLDLLLAGGEPPWRACGNEVAPYLSPEVLAGAPATTASDVFGLGAVLYRLLTGQGPCGHGADGESARRFWAEGQTPRAVRDCQPSVPQSLSDLCSRMLAAEPSHRPADLVDLGQSLASGSKARTVASQPELARRARASVVSPRPTPPPPRPAQENRRPGRSRGTWVDLLIGIGLAVLLVLAVGVYVRTHGWPGWLHQPPAALPSPGERDVEGMAAPQAPPEAPAPGDPVPVPTAPEDSKAAGVLPPGGEGTATVAGGTPERAA